MTGKRLEIGTEVRSVGGDEIGVIRVDGEVDMNNADELAGAIRAQRAHSERAVLLDLIRVPFMDSSGLRVLLIASEELPGRLAMVLSPGSPVRRLLELTEVDDRIPTYPLEEDAFEAIASGAVGG